MNPLDIAIIIALCFCLIRGLFRGLVKEIASIIGVLAGFYAAYTYYPVLSDLLEGWITNNGYANLIGFLFIFCVVFLTISILGIVIKYLLSIAYMGWVDRVGGIGFGLIKGLLLVSVLIVVMTAFLPKGAPVLRQSLVAPHVMLVAEQMAKMVSKDMKRKFADKRKFLQKAWYYHQRSDSDFTPYSIRVHRFKASKGRLIELQHRSEGRT